MPKKKSVSTKTTQKRASSKAAHVDQALLDNFVALQRVLTNLSVKFDDLSDNISKLLQLFEISAKHFAEHYPEDAARASADVERSVDKQFLDKLDNLLDQNKTISKGIMMMEERIRERAQPRQVPTGMMQRRPLPRY